MIDYRKELEKAARQMILIHNVQTLIKLILRAVVRNLKLEHAGIFLYRKDKDDYVINVSKGKQGLRIPSGFAKISRANPIIRYFLEKDKRIGTDEFLIYKDLVDFLRRAKFRGKRELKLFFEELRFQLELFQAQACIPGFFREKLIGLLFLGEKKDREPFTIEETGFLSVLASDVVMAIQNAWLFEDLKKEFERNKKLFLNSVKALALAIEAKDRYTLGHTERVTSYSLILLDEVRKIKKIPFKEYEALKEKLRIASLLHDIGKIGIREKVLNKKGLLTKEEKKEIQKHPLLGFEILKPIEEFRDISEAVKYHHERYDGKGYPEGLKGRKIPLLASIISVADAFDAMTSQRPYRKALSKEKALNRLKRESKKQFHPLIVKAFLRAYKKKML